MNNELNRDMSIQDSENNNVDENSNDHQYNQYANYHNQFTNHQYRSHVGNEQNHRGNDVADEPVSVRPRVNLTSGIHRRQHVDDEIDFRSLPGLSSHHRRTLSEDNLYSTSDLPQLPRSRTANHHRNQLLNPSSHWYSPLHRRRTLPSEEETRNEGTELLYNFVSDQFRHENLNPADYLPSCPGYSTSSLLQTGRDLRMLADEFARSQERKELMFKAQQVDMGSITFENFFLMCSELFCRDDRGFTRERIVVLFTFICDVAIQQVRQRAERFISQLMEWSLQFIFRYICSWVQEAGGWGVVLSRGANLVYNATKFTFAVFCVVALGVYIKKNWHHS